MTLRQQAGERYTEALVETVKTPYIAEDRTSVYAQYTIQVADREAVQTALKEGGGPTAVHYPVPLYRQPAFSELAYQPEKFSNAEQASHQVTSLPIHPYITGAEQVSVITALLAT